MIEEGKVEKSKSLKTLEMTFDRRRGEVEGMGENWGAANSDKKKKREKKKKKKKREKNKIHGVTEDRDSETDDRFSGGGKRRGQKWAEKGRKRAFGKVNYHPKTRTERAGVIQFPKLRAVWVNQKRTRVMTMCAAVFRARRNGRERSHLGFYYYTRE
jgi:hypothetical protein